MISSYLLMNKIWYISYGIGIVVVGQKLRVMKLQKLEYVIFGRFQRPITPKFRGAGKNAPHSLYDTVLTSLKKSSIEGFFVIPREAKLYSFELVGLSVRPSVKTLCAANSS